MSNIEKQVLDLGTMPTKGIDYWTPEEAEEMNNAKNGAIVAAQEARTAKQETDAATDRANEAATNANGAAGAAREKAGEAEAAASAANNAATNANQAAANGNTQYNVLKNYHDNVTIPDHTRAEQDHTRANTDHTTAASDHTTATTDHTNVTTTWRKEFTDAQAARAAEFNRTQQEKQTEFERTQQEKQAIFDADHLRAENDHNTLAGGKVVELDKAISPYAKNLSLPLTHNLATGSILAMEGDMVVLKAQEGWGITRIDREEFGGLGLASGDTLLLPMAHFDQEGKPTDNLMLVGAVLFAAEEAVKGQSGEVLYTRRTSLFRATDNAIATWGGVKKWLAIADNESLLICHPLDITSATITRNGNDAANAAADLNQRRRIEEKLNLGGKDPRAWVGMADQLAPSEKTEQAAYRDEVLPSGRILGYAPELGPDGAGTRDGQIADDVSPVMREVSGVSGGSGQMNSKVAEDISRTYTGNYQSVVLDYNVKGIIGHKYLATAMMKSSDGKSFWFGIAPSNLGYGATCATTSQEFKQVAGIAECRDYNGATHYLGTWGLQGSTGDIKKDTASILDLTLLPQLPAPFVASLTSSDAHRVAHALGFLALQRD